MKRLKSDIQALMCISFAIAVASVEECKKTGLGSEYRGFQNTTNGGIICQRWDAHTPHPHYSITAEIYPDSGLNENYCRNPDGEPNGPWCYTTSPQKRWDYCPVPFCPMEIDECASAELNQCVHVCTNTIDSYSCSCNSGFVKLGEFDCADIDECLSNPCHMYGSCINTIGSYQCICKEGFSGDGMLCQDLDECKSNICHADAFCLNTIGSYKCICELGYTGNGDTCFDFDECLTDACHSNATCTNTVGSFSCQCTQGFTGDGFTCQDVNECEAITCADNEQCINTAGSYYCACFPGFVKSGKQCIDADECSVGSATCHINATCSNTFGSFQCFCNPGFAGNGTSCEDVDECIENPSCQPYFQCVNTMGSYSCQCMDGFTLNETVCSGQSDCQNGPVSLTSCIDKDECHENTDACSSNATCVNTFGSYQCICDHGYTSNGFSCNDTDECRDDPCNATIRFVNTTSDPNCVCNGTHCICGANRICINTVGSYHCVCREGFAVDGSACVDVDECQSMDVCHINASCVNTIGSYRCSCHRGFKGDGLSCQEITMCERANLTVDCACQYGFHSNGTICLEQYGCINNTCQNDSICSYKCMCQSVSNSSEDMNCSERGQCLNASCQGNETYVTCQHVNGSESSNNSMYFRDFTILDDIDASPESCEKTCDLNETHYFQINSNATVCKDIDECQSAGACHENAKCMNTLGSYQCICDDGFTGNGKICNDVNECDHDNACQANAACLNTIGSYNCPCRLGFIGNGTDCIDADECLLGKCHTYAVCENSIGSYQCICKDGFKGDGMECNDQDECQSDPCPIDNTCINTVGSYNCKDIPSVCKNGPRHEFRVVIKIYKAELNNILIDTTNAVVIRSLEDSNSILYQDISREVKNELLVKLGKETRKIEDVIVNSLRAGSIIVNTSICFFESVPDSFQLETIYEAVKDGLLSSKATVVGMTIPVTQKSGPKNEIPSQDVNGMIVGLCVGFGVLIVLLLASWKFTKGKNYRMRLRVAYGNFRFGNRVTPDGKAHKLYETEEKPDLQIEEGEDTGNNVNATGV